MFAFGPTIMQIADVTTSTNTTTYNVQLRRAAWHATCYLPRPEIEIKKIPQAVRKLKKNYQNKFKGNKNQLFQSSKLQKISKEILLKKEKYLPKKGK